MYNLIRISLLTACFLLAISSNAQTEKAPKVREEKVESVWQFAKYLGGKLGTELKSRLNLEGEETATEKVQVKIKIWKYSVIREEKRKVN